MPYDQCQTPSYAVEPLLPFLQSDWIAWEPACGEGNIVNVLAKHVTGVIGTDLISAPPRNFFDWQPMYFDCLVTNPPYSIKYDWLAHCYALGKPFALLMPLETAGAAKAQRLFEQHGVEIMLLDKRVNFKMPNKGWSGSAAQFPVAWFCWKLLPSLIVYGKITQRHNDQLALFDQSAL
jgi:hypothetical protein